MAALLTYIIRWAVTLTLLYSCYGLLLRRETFHHFNRAVLVGILLLSMALPLCRFETSEPTAVALQMERIENTLVSSDFVLADEPWWEAENIPDAPAKTASVRSVAVGVVMAIYLFGTVALLLHYLFSLAALVRIICTSRKAVRLGAVRIFVNPSVPTAFGWMNWIVLGKSLDTPEGRMICEHEMAHVRLLHSCDMLLAELTARLLWPLPFGWMLRADLRDVHEYEADRYVLNHGAEREAYGLMLIHNAARPSLPAMANSFSNHSIKNRLKMIYRKPSHRRAALKAAYLLPLALLAVTAFARPTAMEELVQIVEEEVKSIPQILPAAASETVVMEETVAEEPVVLPMDTVKADREAEAEFEAPVYPGGEAALMELLKNNLRHKGADGRVMVRFTISETGEARDFNIMRSVNPDTDAEAIRVLLMMKRWTPAKKDGKPVAMPMTLPVSFRGGSNYPLSTYKAGNASGNPRGVYKLKCIITPDGREIAEPFDQYKICMDDKTLMLSVAGSRFHLQDNDHMVFDYTGEAPDAENPHKSRIYDSDASGFTMKWWSRYVRHRYFPNNDWCTERYESGSYSDTGRVITEALMQAPALRNPSAPLVGTWRYLGDMDELSGVKKKLRRLKKDNETLPLRLWVLTNDYSIDFSVNCVDAIRTAGDMIIFAATDHEIYATWLDDSHVALSNEYDGQNTYHIWQRIEGTQSVLEMIK